MSFGHFGDGHSRHQYYSPTTLKGKGIVMKFVTAHQKRLLKKQRRRELKIILVGITLMWLAMALPLMIFS
tara:strand:- start:187 stop:396 length:210 start_codon:yes stop_codon:yes gene_type:complete